MCNFTIPMALMDYIPVIFFGVAAFVLQKDLCKKMRGGTFALFAAGIINIFASGFLKTTWKLLYAAGICDFAALNTIFLPVQSMGFQLAGLGMGALTGQDMTLTWVNWVEQGINCVGQGLLMWGVLILHKAGLHQLKL